MSKNRKVSHYKDFNPSCGEIVALFICQNVKVAYVPYFSCGRNSKLRHFVS